MIKVFQELAAMGDADRITAVESAVQNGLTRKAGRMANWFSRWRISRIQCTKIRQKA